MITAILADDNVFCLQHYAALVDWGTCGFRLAATASDGIEAYAKFQKYHPEVVITDIQMPGLSGIELAGKIRQEAPQTIVIFLSSYNEFDYARSAIRLSVQEYILKTELTRERLIKKLSEIRALLQQREKTLRSFQAQFLSSCFQNPNALSEPSAEHAPAQNPFRLLLLLQNHLPDFLTRRCAARTEEADGAKVKSLLSQYVPEIYALSHCGHYLWLCVCDPEASPKMLAEHASQALNSASGASFSAFAFPVFDSAAACIEYFPVCRLVLRDSYIIQNTSSASDCSFFAPEDAARPGRESGSVSGSGSDPGTLSALFQAIAELHTQAALAALEELFLPDLLSRNVSALLLHSAQVLDRLQECAQICAEYPDCPFSLYTETDSLLSFSAFFQWLKDKTAALILAMAELPQTQSHLLNKAIAYVFQQYRNPLLSVEDVARWAGLSVNGLNYLFKKNRQETAGRFITRVRMEKASQLLLETQTRISELPEQTGYSSASYFTRVFRRYYGTSPSEYQLCCGRRL